MIDIATLKGIAPNHFMSQKKLNDELGETIMNSDTLPTKDDFALLLPPYLMGYCMEEKSWCEYSYCSSSYYPLRTI